jgi:predicted dehydrogenase
VEDHVCCLIEFPGLGYKAGNPVDCRKKIAVNYASINGNGFGGYGEIVFGTKGTLVLEKELEALLFKDSDVDTKVGVSKGKEGPTLDTQASGAAQSAAVGAMATQNVSRGYTEELEHFAWCLRNRSPENLPKCRAEVAMGDAVIALTTNKAAREEVRIEFKEEWFQADSDETPEGVKPDLTRYA